MVLTVGMGHSVVWCEMFRWHLGDWSMLYVHVFVQMMPLAILESVVLGLKVLWCSFDCILFQSIKG